MQQSDTPYILILGLLGIIAGCGYVFVCYLTGLYFRRGRGRSFSAGFLLALAFSPLLAWLYGMLLQANQESLDAQQLAAGALKECPACADLVKTKAVKCRHCGESLDEQEAHDATNQVEVVVGPSVSSHQRTQRTQLSRR